MRSCFPVSFGYLVIIHYFKFSCAYIQQAMAFVLNVVAVYLVRVAVAVLKRYANLVAAVFWVCYVF
jgi:hypothetical protein